MPKLFIFCDESTDRGEVYSNFFGGILVRGEHIHTVQTALETFKTNNGLTSEIKWGSTSPNKAARYKGFLDLIFDFVEKDMLKIRIFFSENKKVPESVAKFEPESKYTKLYYQFLKHSFGLKYANPDPTEKMEIFISLDEMPVNALQKRRFKEYLSGIPTLPDFRTANLSLEPGNISEYKSKTQIFGQAIDLILGAIQFKLNKKDLYREPGSRLIPKKTKARMDVYKHLSKRLTAIRPFFNIGISTGLDNIYENKWNHGYRHWNFVANINNTNMQTEIIVNPPSE